MTSRIEGSQFVKSHHNELSSCSKKVQLYLDWNQAKQLLPIFDSQNQT